MRKFIRLAIFLFIVQLMSCSKSRLPDGVLDTEKMQAVYWDYIRADVYANETIRSDSNRDAARENIKLQNKIFDLHNITKEEFYKSYDYYLKHPALMQEMIDTMTVRQQKKIDMIREEKAKADSAAKKFLDTTLQ